MLYFLQRVIAALTNPFRVSYYGRPHWQFLDGTRVRIIGGGDGPLTLTDLTDERARVLDEIDDVINTAKEASRAFTDEERERHDAAVARIEGEGGLDELIRAATIEDGDRARLEGHEVRRARYAVAPNVNLNREAIRGGRSLDELLWSTDESVPAGTLDKTGSFRQHSTARNAVDQVIVRSSDGDPVAAPRITEFLPENRQVVRSFQATVAEMSIFGMMIDEDARNSRHGFEVARAHKAYKDRWQEILRALDTDTAAEGTEWVPTGIGANLHEKVRAMGKVAPMFSRIDLPTNPWKWPIEGADATIYRVPEPTGDTESKPTASTPGTVAATFDAEIFGGRTLFSRSLEADSALAILPYATKKLVTAFYIGEERAIIDGDTDGTHQDSDVGASTTDARTAWDGLRKRGLAQTTQATTATSVANLALIRKAMGKWGVNPADLFYLVGVSGFYALVTDANFLTVDKMGPNATIHNGQVGSLFGSPVIVSEFVREDLNASGVYDGITTTKTVNMCVNRNEWAIGQRMALDVQVDDSIYRETFQRVVIAFQREDFQAIATASTDEIASIGYNVTP